jgi:hypothetical protein
METKMTIRKPDFLWLAAGATALAMTPAFAETPTYKMTTDIPANVLTPDKMESSLGSLEFFDGIPTNETAQKIWDYQDLSRAVEMMIAHVPAASLAGFRKGIREFGPDNETMIIFEGRLDPRGLLLTGNTTVVYSFMWIDLKDGPMVMETPPNVLGIIDDAWFRYLTDFGNAGDDKGKGGKYLLVGPDYTGDIPEGYIVKQSKTYGHWLAMRGFMQNFEHEPVVDNMKEHFKLYPLGSEPKDVNWVNVSGKSFNTLHAQDAGFFEEVNEIVQEEPHFSHDSETIGLLASIGIEKGKPFEPDARMSKIFDDAAKIGTATMRAIVFNNRDKDVQYYPNSETWEVGFAGGNYEFLRNDASLSNNRARFHFYATGITPAMVNPGVGKGSQYLIGARDADGNPFDGAKTYTMHVAPDVPMENFWDVTLYDNQTRSLMQTDQMYPGVSSIDEAIIKNADGSYDITFSPEKPEGEANWLQTIPGKGWNILWRIYSPTQPWFDKAWQPGEVVLKK